VLIFFSSLVLSSQGPFASLGVMTLTFLFLGIIVYNLVALFVYIFTFIYYFNEVIDFYRNSPLDVLQFCKDIAASTLKGGAKCFKVAGVTLVAVTPIYEYVKFKHHEMFPEDESFEEGLGKIIKDRQN
jgi:predicted RND superfamily exporter protein